MYYEPQIQTGTSGVPVQIPKLRMDSGYSEINTQRNPRIQPLPDEKKFPGEPLSPERGLYTEY